MTEPKSFSFHLRFIVVTLALVSGCGGNDDGTGPATTGEIEATTTTTGEDLDPDGYTVTVNGGPGQSVGVNASVTFGSLSPGDYDVELTGAAANCTVAGSNPRSVTVSAGATASTTFSLTCSSQTGSIEVTTSTTGSSLDPDGYTVTVDGGVGQSIDVNGSTTFAGIAAGDREVELTGVASNCMVAGDNPRTVTVTGGSMASTGFDVSCVPVLQGQMVFTSDRDGNTEIYVMNADGSGQTRLTNNSASDASPAVSPDGTRIAFVTDRDGQREIYVMSADGTDPVRLTTTLADEEAPAWSPDGTQIAFTTDADGQREIYVMDADGSNPVNLTVHPDFDSGPAWSPDGAQIAFESTRDGAREIYVMDADGSNPLNISNTSSSDFSPDWSPDGSRITFSIFLGIDALHDVWVMDADGSNQTNLTNSNAMFTNVHPAWSPDGTQIAFSTDRDGDNEIYVVDADGSNPLNLSNASGASDNLPDWSPE